LGIPAALSADSLWLDQTPSLPADLTAQDETGKSITVDAQANIDWYWTHQDDREELTFRITATFPAGTRLKIKELDQARRIKDGERELIFISKVLPATLAVSIQNDGGSDQNINLSVIPKGNQPLYAIHSSCIQQKIGIRTLQDLEQLEWAYAYCQPRDANSVVMSVFSSAPEKLQVTGGWWTHRPNPNLTTFIIAKPPVGVPFGTRLRISTAAHGIGTYSLVWVAPKDDLFVKPFGFTLGAGLSYAKYQEPRVRIELPEAGINLKGGLRRSLIQNRLDVDVSAYTLLAQSLSTTTASAAHFFGANIRLGYKLPISLAKLQWYTFLGFYYWKMLVNSQNFGVDLLTGPQIFLSARSDVASARPFFTYLKYALMVDSDQSLHPNNRELAVGAGIQIIRWRRQSLYWTADLAHMSMTSVDGINGFSLLSLSTGAMLMF
jgi:hypothetical protein